MQERMCLEADRIRGAFEREMLRVCRAYDLHAQGIVTESQLLNLHKVIFSGKQPDLIQTFDTIRLTFTELAQETTDRHYLECQAFAAIQCLSWDLDGERLVPSLTPPRIVLEEYERDE
eukprot:m.259035 g.259035  ORF g.259035 m.259035 type:complete len:118 (-) comp54579_c0_seq26:1286-1639(-)